MYKHILVPVDGTKLSQKALDTAAGLAKALGAKVTAVTVSPAYPAIIAGDGYMVEPISSKEWEKSVAKHTERVRIEVEKRAASKGLTLTFVSATTDQPYDGIIETASLKKCDLIIMASHGRRGMSALLLGSETTKVLTHSKVPVLVVR
jgi:nucleotide-binding universal stress UspA family protein